MKDPSDLSSQLVKECQDILLNNILPYWEHNMTDPDGGFYGRRDGNDILYVDAPRGAILNARILWAFSAAYRVLKLPHLLETATRAKREIIDRFIDHEFGGVFWSIDPNGNPLDSKKQFYAIGFAIYGLSEYFRATGDTESLEWAAKLFHDIETHSRDRVNGGYIEAMTRCWDPIEDMRLSDKDTNASKTMNTHLHIIEPYTNLLRVWSNENLREATASLLDVFLERIVGHDGHLGLFYDKCWNRVDDIISYGHDIEASWLLLETAQVLNDSHMLAKTLEASNRIAIASLEGRLPDGSMIYERCSDGHSDTDRHWWVQAEMIVGLVWLYKYHGNNDALVQAFDSWKYIKSNLIDNDGGEWFWSRKADGTINRHDDKAGFWKCPYHNTRMCLEVIENLSQNNQI